MTKIPAAWEETPAPQATGSSQAEWSGMPRMRRTAEATAETAAAVAACSATRNPGRPFPPPEAESFAAHPATYSPTATSAPAPKASGPAPLAHHPATTAAPARPRATGSARLPATRSRSAAMQSVETLARRSERTGGAAEVFARTLPKITAAEANPVATAARDHSGAGSLRRSRRTTPTARSVRTADAAKTGTRSACAWRAPARRSR